MSLLKQENNMTDNYHAGPGPDYDIEPDMDEVDPEDEELDGDVDLDWDDAPLQDADGLTAEGYALLAEMDYRRDFI
jgi:hypothetical protein